MVAVLRELNPIRADGADCARIHPRSGLILHAELGDRRRTPHASVHVVEVQRVLRTVGQEPDATAKQTVPPEQPGADATAVRAPVASSINVPSPGGPEGISVNAPVDAGGCIGLPPADTWAWHEARCSVERVLAQLVQRNTGTLLRSGRPRQIVS